MRESKMKNYVYRICLENMPDEFDSGKFQTYLAGVLQAKGVHGAIESGNEDEEINLDVF